MKNWFFGVIADCAYALARGQQWVARNVVIAFGNRLLDSAECLSVVDDWASGDDPWLVVCARRAKSAEAPVEMRFGG